VVAEDAVEHAKRFGLFVDVLDDGFNDQIAVLQILELRRAAQVAERFVLLFNRDLALLDAPREKLLDAAEALLERAFLDLANDRLIP
jgi:hypothetical protein